MENKEINFLQLLKTLLRKAWIIILAMLVCGGMAFGYAKMFITPVYRAKATLHVNNANDKNNGTYTDSELAAAKTLLETYVVILKSRNTLEEVKTILGSEYSYTYEQLASMVSASSINSTDIFAIYVTCPKPDDAQLIANIIVDVLPSKIANIVGGGYVNVVDYARTPSAPSSPNVTNNTMLGALVGLIVSCAIICIIEFLNDRVRSADDLKSCFEYPILASIPSLLKDDKSKKYGYHYYYYQHSNVDNGGEEQ